MQEMGDPSYLMNYGSPERTDAAKASMAQFLETIPIEELPQLVQLKEQHEQEVDFYKKELDKGTREVQRYQRDWEKHERDKERYEAERRAYQEDRTSWDNSNRAK